MAHASTVSPPEGNSWMLFIDGENFTMRGQELADKKSVTLTEGRYYCKDTFLWIPGFDVHERCADGHLRLSLRSIRSIYYTSVIGDTRKMEKIRTKLWELKFQPETFKRKRGERGAKGVDIALTKDMLSNAFQNNYDVAVLITGDGDYVPAIEEVRRLGKVVYLAFFETIGLNRNLKLACDSFTDMTQKFVHYWQQKRDDLI